MKKSNRIFNRCFQHLILILIILFTSCSLKYSEQVNSEDKVPEFVFEDTKLVRFEKKNPTIEVSAQKLEQYKNSSESYGQQVTFTSYDDKGEVETEGSCGILYADTDKKIYELYDDINLYNSAENMRFYANALRWNGRTEQLTSGRGDMVKIEKDDTIMRGSGFTASGISKTFSFRGNITGTIETSDENSEEESENVE